MSVQLAIGPAEISDRFQMIPCAKSFLIESGRDLNFCPAYAEATAIDYTTDPQKLALVFRREADICGIFLAAAIESPLGPFKTAQELCWWVDPKFRSMASVDAVLAIYEAFARDAGCKEAALASLSPGSMTRLFALKGYAPAETHFFKVL